MNTDPSKSCDGKKVYTKLETANAVALHMMRTTHECFRVYPCEWSHRGKWHVGHSRPTQGSIERGTFRKALREGRRA